MAGLFGRLASMLMGQGRREGAAISRGWNSAAESVLLVALPEEPIAHREAVSRSLSPTSLECLCMSADQSASPSSATTSRLLDKPVEVHLPTKVDPTEVQTLRCGVVGVGRMGRHHARVYAEMPNVELVGVVDADEERREVVSDRHACPAFDSVDALIEAGVDAVSIAVPTTNHLPVARKLMNAGVACLVEKPLARDAEEARELVELSERTGVVLQVGHSERFNPAVRALVREHESHPDRGGIIPRFIEVHRVSPMTFRSVDVSVVFDMMIHDLDVVLMLMDGDEPVEVEASGVPVITEHPDICNARLTFDRPQGKCVANITASRLALKTERKIRIIGDDAYVSVDYARKSGVVIRRTANRIQLEEVRDELRRGTDLSDLDYGELVALENLEIDDAEPLRMQAESFLDAIRTGERPEVDAQAGFAAVRTAERIEASIMADLKAP